MARKISVTISEESTEPKRKYDDPQPGERRATFHIKDELFEKMKAIAYWERVTIKEVTNTIFEQFLIRYEKHNGPIRSIPKRNFRKDNKSVIHS